MNTEVLDRPTVAEQTPSAIATNITSVQGEVAKFDKIAAGLAAIEAAHPKNVIVDAINTPAGMRSAESAWRAWRGPRLEVEKARKAAKAPVLALGKAIDTFAAELEAKLSAGEDHYKAQITAEEERRAAEKAEAARKEAERLDGLRLEVDAILAGWLDRCKTDGMTADRVQAGITALTAAAMPDVHGLQDVATHWDSAKLLTLGKMERIRLDLERAELQAQRDEQARQDAERAKQQAAELQKARDESARITSATRRISEIHAAATGHDKATAWELFEAITAVEALDVSAAQYQEFAAAAETAQASTLAALRAKHSAAVAREDEQAKAAELAAQRAESERLERLADENRQRLAAEAVEPRIVIVGDMRPEKAAHINALVQQRIATREAADAAPVEELAPETVDPDLVLAAAEQEPAPAEPDEDRAFMRTMTLCMEALAMLGRDGDASYWRDAHTQALTEAVDAFAAQGQRLEVRV